MKSSLIRLLHVKLEMTDMMLQCQHAETRLYSLYVEETGFSSVLVSRIITLWHI